MGVFFTIANSNAAKDDEQRKHEKIIAIAEVVVLVFLVTFIPSLIRLGKPPTCIEDVWVELLVAVLASLYAYARIRGIELEPKPEE